MLSEPQRTYLDQAARTIQIISLSLIFGVIVFGLVLLFFDIGAEKPAEAPFLAIIAAVFALVSAVAAPLVASMVTSGMRLSIVAGKQISAGSTQAIPEDVGEIGVLAGVYQTQQIISRAILEGAAFMNLAAYMTERQPMSLGFGAFLLIAMFFKFPTRNHLENWIRKEMTTIEQLRSFED